MCNSIPHVMIWKLRTTCKKASILFITYKMNKSQPISLFFEKADNWSDLFCWLELRLSNKDFIWNFQSSFDIIILLNLARYWNNFELNSTYYHKDGMLSLLHVKARIPKTTDTRPLSYQPKIIEDHGSISTIYEPHIFQTWLQPCENL